MISANNVTLRLGKRALFEDVNIKVYRGKLLRSDWCKRCRQINLFKDSFRRDLNRANGDVIMNDGERLSVLQQDHFKYDEYMVLDTVIMGNKRLYDIMKEKDAIYAKEDFTDEDGIRAS